MAIEKHRSGLPHLSIELIIPVSACDVEIVTVRVPGAVAHLGVDRKTHKQQDYQRTAYNLHINLLFDFISALLRLLVIVEFCKYSIILFSRSAMVKDALLKGAAYNICVRGETVLLLLWWIIRDEH